MNQNRISENGAKWAGGMSHAMRPNGQRYGRITFGTNAKKGERNRHAVRHGGSHADNGDNDVAKMHNEKRHKKRKRDLRKSAHRTPYGAKEPTPALRPSGRGGIFRGFMQYNAGMTDAKVE